jgi:SAM-dependent methyltransferase
MNDLPFADRSFDLIWSEGAIFVIGFAKGLAEWRRLLKPGGHLVVSEYCWLRDDPPDDLREVHTEGCPDVGNIAARRHAVETNGYDLVAEFLLPEVGWWENYYVPLADRLERFRDSHAGNAAALDVAASSQQEIDLYRRYAGWFGYVFFVMRQKD